MYQQRVEDKVIYISGHYLDTVTNYQKIKTGESRNTQAVLQNPKSKVEVKNIECYCTI